MKKAKRTSLSYMVAAARKVWRWTEERKQVIERCKFFDKFKCEKCGAQVDFIEKKGKLTMPIQVDHKVPVGAQPRTWAEFGPWLERLFCPLSNLWGICLKCHRTKTNGENKIRRAKKGEKK